MQVASVYWDVGCVEVKPKHKMTNRFAALEEEDDGEMAHPPGLAGTYGVCAVQKSQKVKRVEVTVDSGAEESVASQVVARDPHDERRRRKKKVSGGKWSGNGSLWPKEDQVWAGDLQHEDDVF